MSMFGTLGQDLKNAIGRGILGDGYQPQNNLGQNLINGATRDLFGVNLLGQSQAGQTPSLQQDLHGFLFGQPAQYQDSAPIALRAPSVGGDGSDPNAPYVYQPPTLTPAQPGLVDRLAGAVLNPLVGALTGQPSTIGLAPNPAATGGPQSWWPTAQDQPTPPLGAAPFNLTAPSVSDAAAGYALTPYMSAMAPQPTPLAPALPGPTPLAPTPTAPALSGPAPTPYMASLLDARATAPFNLTAPSVSDFAAGGSAAPAYQPPAPALGPSPGLGAQGVGGAPFNLTAPSVSDWARANPTLGSLADPSAAYAPTQDWSDARANPGPDLRAAPGAGFQSDFQAIPSDPRVRNAAVVLKGPGADGLFATPTEFDPNAQVIPLGPSPRDKGAGVLMDFISSPALEGTAGSNGYDRIYGDNNGKTYPKDWKKPTEMTVDEAIARAPEAFKLFKSSALGKYQFLGGTLQTLKGKMALTGSERLTPELQDTMARELLRGQGYDKVLAGTMDPRTFENNLAKTWDSVPLTSGYYRSDKTQSRQSRVSVDQVQQAITNALQQGRQ